MHVAVSEVGSLNNFFILVDHDKTKMIVYGDELNWNIEKYLGSYWKKVSRLKILDILHLIKYINISKHRCFSNIISLLQKHS